MKLSIITVAYNDCAGLTETLHSLVSQSDQNFEWLVIDGGSTDDTYKRFNNEKRVNLFVHEKDEGIYYAMNKGLEKASGDYVLFLNAGDILASENTVGFVKSVIQDDDIYYFASMFLYGGGMNMARRPRNPSKYIRYSVPANHQATVYKTSSIKKYKYDVRFRICGDYYISAKLLSNGHSFKCDSNIISKFAIGGVSTYSFKRLVNEASCIQKEVLGIGLPLRVLMACVRTASMFMTYCVYKVRN